MMERGTFLRLGYCCFLAAPLAVQAQLSGKKLRIGVLNIGGGAGSVIDPFFQGLRDLGWAKVRMSSSSVAMLKDTRSGSRHWRRN